MNAHQESLASQVSSAGFQTCCVADFQVGNVTSSGTLAGLETRDTADLEVCATVHGQSKFDVSQLRILALIVALVLILLCGGCVSKSQAQAQARLAYMAGQRDAFAQMQRRQADPDIKFTGPLNNPTVKWYEGLTLAKAIVAAGYNSTADPKFIIIRRANQEIQLDPKRLLHGDDIPLEAGDVIEFRME